MLVAILESSLSLDCHIWYMCFCVEHSCLSRCSPMKGGNNLQDPSNSSSANFKITYRIRLAWGWSNTINHTSGNIRAVISIWNVKYETCVFSIEQLCNHLYLLHQPEGVPQVEFVFIHGLQLSDANNAWWTTWARKGAKSKCWPKTLLVQRFPKAQVFSLSYDASAIKPATSGKPDSYALGEKLLHSMKIAGIGQRNRPVVFVCHSLGGLVAKQIVVTGYRHFRQDEKVQNLLNNIRGFFFYATPHSGSKLADLCSNLPRMSPLVDHLKLINDGLGRLNSEFEKITKLDEYKDTWKFLAVRETEVTSVVSILTLGAFCWSNLKSTLEMICQLFLSSTSEFSVFQSTFCSNVQIWEIPNIELFIEICNLYRSKISTTLHDFQSSLFLLPMIFLFRFLLMVIALKINWWSSWNACKKVATKIYSKKDILPTF